MDIQFHTDNKEVIQNQLENHLLNAGFEKKAKSILGDFDRIKAGSGDITISHKGKRLLITLTDSLEDFIMDMVDVETKKNRKSRFYTHLIHPSMVKFLMEEKKIKEKGAFERHYTNPMAFIPYLLAKEITKAIVIPDLSVTSAGRKAADSFHKAYFDYNSASDDELLSMIQLIRTFLISEHNKFFKEGKKKDSTVTIVLKEEYSNMEIDETTLIESLSGQYASFKPMLAKPVPHTNLLDSDGGYFIIDSPLLKKAERDIIRQVGFNNNGFINKLNKLQETKWSLNTEFYDWMVECKHPMIQKYFNLDIPSMSADTTKKNKTINANILKLQKLASTARIEAHKNKDSYSEEKLKGLHRIANKATEEVVALESEQEIIKSTLGKAIGWTSTLKDYEFYKQFEYFYHPIFLDNRGRVYTYNTSLSFQGSSIAKALVTTYNKERLTEEGLQALYELLGGMIDGMSKCHKEERIAYVSEHLGDMFSIITHDDYSFIEKFDEDELLGALSIIHTLYNHFNDSEYTTGLLAYIDSTSSAIQIQALVQHCKQAASLTNLIKTEDDKLPDAYKAVASVARNLTMEVSSQNDNDLLNILSDFIKENSPEDLGFINHL